MKILVPWYRFPPFGEKGAGGLSVSVWELSNNLSQIGHEVEILVPPTPSLPISESLGSITVHRNSLGQKIADDHITTTDAKFFEDYDLVLSIDNFGARSLKSLKKRTKVVRQIHTIARDRPVSTYLSLNSNLAEKAKIFVLRRREIGKEKELSGTGSICVSRYLVNRMKEWRLEHECNLTHVPNGLDTHVFRPNQKEVRFDLLFVGRFQRAKGLDVLVRSLNLLSEKGRHFKVGIVGYFDPIEIRSVLRWTSSKVREGLEFLGKISHERLPEILNSSRLLVAPSVYESFGLPILEAISCGVPVVGSKVGGIPELVDGTVGLLAEPGDELSLACCVSNALGDSRIQESASIKGPLRAREYDWSVVRQKFSSELMASFHRIGEQ